MMPNVGDNLGLGNIDDVMDDENILSNLHEDFKMDNDFNDGFLINVFEEITNSPNTVLPGGNTSNPGSPTDNGRHSLSAMNSSTSVSMSKKNCTPFPRYNKDQPQSSVYRNPYIHSFDDPVENIGQFPLVL